MHSTPQVSPQARADGICSFVVCRNWASIYRYCIWCQQTTELQSDSARAPRYLIYIIHPSNLVFFAHTHTQLQRASNTQHTLRSHCRIDRIWRVSVMCVYGKNHVWIVVSSDSLAAGNQKNTNRTAVLLLSCRSTSRNSSDKHRAKRN